MHLAIEPGILAVSGFTPVASETVDAHGAAECPVRMEAVVEAVHGLAEKDESLRGRTALIEVRVTRVHVSPDIPMDGVADRIDPDKWRPLIMSFQEFHGLGSKVGSSRLGTVPESLYRGPDIARARLRHAPP